MPLKVIELGMKIGILARRMVSVLEFFERRHQNLRRKASAVWAEMAKSVRECRGHHIYDHFPGVAPASPRVSDKNAFRAAATKASTFSRSLRPGEDSRLEQASTPHGSAVSMAWATFRAFRPPARTIGTFAPRARAQSNVWPEPPYCGVGESSKYASNSEPRAETRNRGVTGRARQMRMPKGKESGTEPCS